MLGLALAQESLARSGKGDGAVKLGVAARAVGPDADQFFHIRMGRQRLMGGGEQRIFHITVAIRQRSRDARQQVNRRVAALFGDLAVEHDMPVGDPAHGIGDGVVHVVAIHQNGENRGNIPLTHRPRPGALQHLRKLRENRRRIALGGGRFARGEADFALRHGEAGDAVHQEEHMLALIAEMFGHGHGGPSGLAAGQRRLIARGDNKNRLFHPLGAEVGRDEILHLASAFADQRHDHHVAARIACQHGHERRFPDAGAGENAQALALTKRRENIQRADMGREFRPDALAVESARRGGAQRAGVVALGQMSFPVERGRRGADHPALPAFIGADHIAANRDLDPVARRHPAP